MRVLIKVFEHGFGSLLSLIDCAPTLLGEERARIFT